VSVTTPRLILVEGLPGSGKSTTAQWLSHLLGATGLDASWHHEQDADHPVCNYDTLQVVTRAGAASCAAFHAEGLERWQDLVRAASASSRVTILESSFLQAPIGSMLLAGCSRDAIGAHVKATAAIAAPLSPMLIVLKHLEPSPEAVEALRASRGPWFDAFLEGLVRETPYTFLDLLRGHAQMIDALLPQVGLTTLVLDARERGWDGVRRTIADRLGVPMRDLHRVVDAPGRFIGRYRDTDTQQELIVAADGQGLFLEATGTRLLPRGDATFELEGLSVEVTFDRGEQPEDGARLMRCRARLSNIGPTWVRA
jgi:hypothetical protein